MCASGSLHTKCDDEVSLHFNAFSPLDAVLHIQNIAEKEKINVDYLKTETKPFSHNTYLLHFLEGPLSSLHSRLTQEPKSM